MLTDEVDVMSLFGPLWLQRIEINQETISPSEYTILNPNLSEVYEQKGEQENRNRTDLTERS